MSWQQVKPQKKHLLIALAFAAEWTIAFAFAKRFANALADANYELAIADAKEDIAFANANKLNLLDYGQRDHERRLTTVERAHGWSPLDDDARPSPTPHEDGRHRLHVDD